MPPTITRHVQKVSWYLSGIMIIQVLMVENNGQKVYITAWQLSAFNLSRNRCPHSEVSYSTNLSSKFGSWLGHFLYNSHFVHLHYRLFEPWWCDFSHLSQSRGFDFIVKRSPKWHSWSFTHLCQLEYFRVSLGWGHYQSKAETTEYELPMFKDWKRIW